VKYQVAVYFDGPRSRWAEKLHPDECVYLGHAPWLWLARLIARSNLGHTGRCSYAITVDGKTVDKFIAPNQVGAT
jgi:hypothetical protein